MIKECVMCGKQFNAYHKGDRYCSSKCRNRANGIRQGRYGKHGTISRECAICGRPFSTNISWQITCSEECSKKRHNATRERTLTPDQKEKRKEYDRQRYLKTHPEARTAEEIHEAKLVRQTDAEHRRKEREDILARNIAHKEAIKQANIAYWHNYEAEHECCVCGKKFIAYYPLTKYCSDTCRRKNQRVRDNRHRYKDITVDRGITLPKLAKRDHNQCMICGLFVDWSDYIQTDKTKICGDMYPSIDHIKPISLGGVHSWDNVQLAHRGCNTRKNNKYIG